MVAERGGVSGRLPKNAKFGTVNTRRPSIAFWTNATARLLIAASGRIVFSTTCVIHAIGSRNWAYADANTIGTYIGNTDGF